MYRMNAGAVNHDISVLTEASFCFFQVVENLFVSLGQSSASGLFQYIYLVNEGQTGSCISRSSVIVLTIARHHIGIAVSACKVSVSLVLLECCSFCRTFFHLTVQAVDVVDDVIGIGNHVIVTAPKAITLELRSSKLPTRYLKIGRRFRSEVEQVRLHIGQNAVTAG